MLRLISLAGIFVLLGLCFVLSHDRKAIAWRTVIAGMLLQALLGGMFLYWQTGNRWLRSVGQSVKSFLDLAQAGTEFVFGDLGRTSSPSDLILLASHDAVHFVAAGPLAAGASSPTLASGANGVVVAVFEWPAADLPPALSRLGVSRRVEGTWTRPAALSIEGLPPDLQAPFDPVLVALPDGWRLYFAAVGGVRGPPALYSARSTDGERFRFEPGVRLQLPTGVLSHPAIARLDGRWHAYVPVRDEPGAAHHAVSEDGSSFELLDTVRLSGAGPWSGSVVAVDDGLRFFGPGWSATSGDGSTWQLAPAPRLADGTTRDPGVTLAPDGTWWMAVPGKQGFGFVFATQVLPTLIFFSSFMAVLYHLGVMQQIVRAMAVVMARLMRTSGAESLSACGNIFVGQTEAPLMVRPFLPDMTTSELHAVMTGGFATIAGGVFALYVGFGIDPGHLMVASVMAAPAGLVCSKLLWPETEVSATMGRVVLTDERTATNVVEAAANGALDGLRLALNVAAMLIAFLGLVAVLDLLLGWFGGMIGEPDLSVGLVLGWLFWPIAAVMGVPSHEILTLGQLLGTKLALTELVAYQQLGSLKAAGAISARTTLIASFALCGFANFGSVAIQIGGLGAIAPNRKADLARLAFRAMFAGAIATCITACLAGVLSHV